MKVIFAAASLLAAASQLVGANQLFLSGASKLPETTSFAVDGVETKGAAVDSQMGQCFNVPESKPTTLKVCGSEIKVLAYAKTRCAEYHVYQTQVGKCDAKLGSACDEVEFGADSTGFSPISYEILPCKEA